MTPACRAIRKHLGGYADGELDGARRQKVALHLEECGPCADALQDIRAIGDLLRTRAAAPLQVEFAGLAGGVISRIRAEEAQSWRAVLGRATGDWHWALTGCGALSAVFFSVLFLAAICYVGPRHAAGDSVAAILDKLEAPSGALFIIATPVGPGQAPMLMRVGESSDVTTRTVDPAGLPRGFSGPSEGELAVALSQAVVSPDGRVRDLRSMSRSVRKDTEALLDEIQWAQWAQRQPVVWVPKHSAQHVTVQRVAFMTTTGVVAAGL